MFELRLVAEHIGYPQDDRSFRFLVGGLAIRQASHELLAGIPLKTFVEEITNPVWLTHTNFYFDRVFRDSGGVIVINRSAPDFLTAAQAPNRPQWKNKTLAPNCYFAVLDSAGFSTMRAIAMDLRRKSISTTEQGALPNDQEHSHKPISTRKPELIRIDSPTNHSLSRNPRAISLRRIEFMAIRAEFGVAMIFTKSTSPRFHSTADFRRFFRTIRNTGQYQVFHSGNEPFAFVAWAWVDLESCPKSAPHGWHPSELNNGKVLAIYEFEIDYSRLGVGRAQLEKWSLPQQGARVAAHSSLLRASMTSPNPEWEQFQCWAECLEYLYGIGVKSQTSSQA